MYHSLFSSSFDEHLCFWLLAIVNKAPMNIIVDLCTLGVEFLGHRLGMYLTLLEITWSFPKGLYHYTLTSAISESSSCSISCDHWCCQSFFFFNKFIYFIYLFLAALGLHCCARAFSSCGKRGLLFVAVRGFSLWWLLLLQSTGSRCTGFSSCGSQPQLWLAGSRAQAQ